MDKKFSQDTSFKKKEFENQHKTMHEMVQWLQVWEKYNNSNKREQPQINSKKKRMR